MSAWNASIDFIYVDLDGVIADFEAMSNKFGGVHKEFKYRPGSYVHLPIYPDAERVVHLLQKSFGEEKIWFLTKPPKNSPYAYSEKALWMRHHFGDVGLNNLIVTMDKSHIGTELSILVDDRPGKGGVENFRGDLVVFGEGPSKLNHWTEALEKIMLICTKRTDSDLITG